VYINIINTSISEINAKELGIAYCVVAFKP